MFNQNYMQNMPRNYQPMYQPNYNPIYTPVYQQGIQGRIVDNADVVRATDIPLDRNYQLFPDSGWLGDSYKTITIRWY